MATILEQAQENPLTASAVRDKTTKAFPRSLLDAIDLRQEPDDGPSMADGTNVDDEPTQFELFQGERLATAWKPREDLLSPEFPLFSLQKGKDTRIRVYRNGEKIMRIIPSVVGAANIFDKDLLVYRPL